MEPAKRPPPPAGLGMFSTKMSPLFNQSEQLIKEDEGLLAKITRAASRVTSRLILWFKSYLGSESVKATHLVRLIDNEEKMSEYEKFKIFSQQIQGLGKRVNLTKPEYAQFTDDYYLGSRSAVIDEAFSFIPALRSKAFYQDSIKEMLDFADKMGANSGGKTEAMNRIFIAHNFPKDAPTGKKFEFITDRLAEDNDPHNVGVFEKAVKEDMDNFTAAMRQLRTDVHYYYQTVEGSREKPALGSKIEEDARHLIAMYEKLIANPAFREAGWKTELDKYLETETAPETCISVDVKGRQVTVNKEFLNVDIYREKIIIQDGNSGTTLGTVSQEKKQEKLEKFVDLVQKLPVKGNKQQLILDISACCRQALNGHFQEDITQEIEQQLGRPIKIEKQPTGNQQYFPSVAYTMVNHACKVQANSKTSGAEVHAEYVLEIVDVQDPEMKLGYAIACVNVDLATGRMNLEVSELRKGKMPMLDPTLQLTSLTNWIDKDSAPTTEGMPNIAETIRAPITMRKLVEESANELMTLPDELTNNPVHKHFLQGLEKINFYVQNPDNEEQFSNFGSIGTAKRRRIEPVDLISELYTNISERSENDDVVTRATICCQEGIFTDAYESKNNALEKNDLELSKIPVTNMQESQNLTRFVIHKDQKDELHFVGETIYQVVKSGTKELIGYTVLKVDVNEKTELILYEWSECLENLPKLRKDAKPTELSTLNYEL